MAKQEGKPKETPETPSGNDIKPPTPQQMLANTFKEIGEAMKQQNEAIQRIAARLQAVEEKGGATGGPDIGSALMKLVDMLKPIIVDAFKDAPTPEDPIYTTHKDLFNNMIKTQMENSIKLSNLGVDRAAKEVELLGKRTESDWDRVRQ